VTLMATEAIVIAGGGSQLSSNTFSQGDAGRIVVSAPTVRLDDGRISAQTTSRGHGGEIEVRAGTVTLTQEGSIITNSSGKGRGGRVTIAAREAIVMVGRGPTRPTRISSDALGGGDAGRIVSSAPTLRLDAGRIQAIVNETSSGLGGEVEVRGDTITLTRVARISTSTFGEGQGGRVTVAANEAIMITGADSVIASTANGRGDAGRVVVSAPMLRLEAGGSITTAAGRQTETGAPSPGKAGDIEVQAGTVTLSGGGHISSSTRGDGGGGDVTVRASEAIVIAGQAPSTPSGLFSSTQGRGPGGNLRLAAPRLQLRDGGTISASSTGDGAAGMLVLDIGETFRSQGGRVTTQSDRAGGGRIELHAGSLIQLIDSELTSAVEGGGSDAGNIFLDVPFVVLDQSLISANAFAGRGGNVLITAEAFLADPASRVSASSDLGIQGTVDIRAPVTTLSGTLAPLPQAFVNVAALLPARCAARLSGGQTSSLVLGGRDGLPADPSGVLPSPLVLEERLVADPTVTGAPHRQTSAARFALLAGHEKGLPRLAGECAN
jgi:large exoprotein involved in heme utilization and adhesion